MKLKDLKNSAVRCIQNVLRVCAVAVVYGYDAKKKHKELRYRLNTIRERVQKEIINDANFRAGPQNHISDLNDLYNNYQDIVIQINYLNKDFMALNDHPNRRQKKWRQRFCNDLNTIWDVLADHQWDVQMQIDAVRQVQREVDKIDDKGYYASLSSFSAASSFASNNSIWSGSSMSGSSCYAESLSGSSVSGSSISLTSYISIPQPIAKDLSGNKYMSKYDQGNVDGQCDGKYEADLLEFMNGFQFDC